MSLDNIWDNIIDFGERSLAVSSTVIVFMLGEVNEAMQAFIVLMIIDYLTGVRKAWKTASLSSKIGSKGLEKKLRIILVIAVAHLVDKILGVPDSSKLSLKFAMLLAYSCNEALSILENLRAVGTWVPNMLKDKLEQVRGKIDKAPEKEKEPEYRPNIFCTECLPRINKEEGDNDGTSRTNEGNGTKEESESSRR